MARLDGGMSWGQRLTGCCPKPLAITSRVMLPFLKCLVGGRRPFHDLSAGETAGPACGTMRRGQESPADKS